jgi:hypothetical protein
MRALLDDEPGESIQLRERALSGPPAAPFSRLLDRGMRSRTLSSVRALDDSVLEPSARRHHALGDLHRVPAARSVNTSVRKFRANAADIVAQLGAESRFQAAMPAKKRGWL